MYLYAYMSVIQESLTAMANGGVIVNISSMAGVGYGPYWYAEYGAAKAAVIRLSAALGFLERDEERTGQLHLPQLGVDRSR